MNEDIREQLATLKAAIDSVVEILRSVSDDASVTREAWATLRLATRQLEVASGNISGVVVDPAPEIV